jgi:hypothetical protein
MTRLGTYELVERIGRTGLAELHRAVHNGPNGFEKTVVVKTLLPSLKSNHELVSLFTAQAKTTAQLSHTGIAQVYDFGIADGLPYVVVEDLDGINLHQLMCAVAASGRRMPVQVALVIATEICQALGFAHQWRDRRGACWQIVHSDVCPENVMVCRDGSVKLLDFGLARVVDHRDRDAVVKAKGNFGYMAPEQVNRHPFDRRVDVFSAGVILHELLTGRRLFGGASDFETLRRVDATEVKMPSAHNAEVTPELDLIVLKSVSRDPDDRYSDGAAMATALQHLGHVGGGRRRVAEFMDDLFPTTPQIYCESCQRQLVPVLTCIECHPPPGRAVPEPVAESAVIASEPAPEAPKPRLLEIDPSREKAGLPKLPPPPPRPRAKTVARPARLGTMRALAAIGVLAGILIVVADISERHRGVPDSKPVATKPVQHAVAAPAKFPSSPVIPVTPPVVAAPPPPVVAAPAPVVAAAPAPVVPAYVPTSVPPPAAPKPQKPAHATTRGKVAARPPQRALPHLSSVVESPRPSEPAPPPPRVESPKSETPRATDPRLLDPF